MDLSSLSLGVLIHKTRVTVSMKFADAKCLLGDSWQELAAIHCESGRALSPRTVAPGLGVPVPGSTLGSRFVVPWEGIRERKRVWGTNRKR